MSTTTSDRRVIHSPDAAPRWDAWRDGSGGEVLKIVVGPSPGSDGKAVSLPSLPEDFATLFPNLTHLYLWKAGGLKTLPRLPEGLQCLDLRGCGDLMSLTPLPRSLDTLVLDGAEALSRIDGVGGGWPGLRELSLAGCVRLPEAGVQALVKGAPALQHLDVSRCGQLTRWLEWPAGLERIEMNGCEALRALPARWPGRLRRLGLRGCRALARIPDLPASIDYLDLGATEGLRHLPDRWGQPRTLVLFGSGILMPPASEHGRAAGENVARRTRAYFEDVALVGRGEVKRCKLLFLGNGGAGKTCLALRLLGRDPGVEKPDSTHGVQFWDRAGFEAEVDGSMEPVHLHFWDFGGQEIYHNTHRLFMSKGAVFVVLWDPAQDDRQPPRCPQSEYQDEWRPLQYWLDLIHLACPHQPRIAVVCSHQSARSEELERRFRARLTEEHRTCRCFFIDSVAASGELAELEEWLRVEVGAVIRTQGMAVPSYWEIAQEMVQSWFPAPEAGKPGGAAARYNELHPDRFREELEGAIRAAVRDDSEGRYGPLDVARREGRFELTDERIHRTLDFLTHSGWVYWDRSLFEGRVIVGQQWALDGIYAVLDRRPTCFIYRELRKADGQFTRKNLHEWVWHDRYTEAEQRLLVSFMKAVDVCFELVPERESWWREAVYKTFEHLPEAKELSLQRRFDRNLDPVSQTLRCARLHKGHWHALLKELGEHYGTDADYAKDGFLLENKEGQTICLVVRMDPGQLGGEIAIQVAGPEARKRLDSLVARVRRHLPGTEPGPAAEREEGGSGDLAGTKPGRIEVFFSYAWDPQNQAIPAGYEAPVDAVYAALAEEPLVNPIRDKKVIQGGDSITAYMQRITTAPKVLIFHSDKYWRSPFCMYELWRVMETFTDRPERMADVLILIEHETSGFKKTEVMDGHRRHWNALKTMPEMLRPLVHTWARLREAGVQLFLHTVPKMAALADRNRRWDPAKASQIIEWVKQLIGLKPPTPKA